MSWNQLKTTTATGQPTPQHKFDVNRMGVNNKVSSSASSAPAVTATAMSTATGAVVASQSKKTSNVGKLLQSFDGVSDLDNGTTQGIILTPPDQGLCVGKAPFWEDRRSYFSPSMSRSKSSALMGTISYGAIPDFVLYNELPNEFISDPRCQYDRQRRTFSLPFSPSIRQALRRISMSPWSTRMAP